MMQRIDELFHPYFGSPDSLTKLFSGGLEGMADWNPTDWANWLAHGARAFSPNDILSYLTAFKPVILESARYEDAEDLVFKLSQAPADFIDRWDKGLALVINSWPENGTIQEMCFLLEMSGHAKGKNSETAIKNFLLKKPLLPNKDISELSKAIVYAVTKRISATEIADILLVMEPVITGSIIAAAPVCAKIASVNPNTFLPNLHKYAPSLFDEPGDSDNWFYTVNRLAEAIDDNVLKEIMDHAGRDAAQLSAALAQYHHFAGSAPRQICDFDLK